jgi:hypothetical protein
MINKIIILLINTKALFDEYLEWVYLNFISSGYYSQVHSVEIGECEFPSGSVRKADVARSD